ncbi:DUF61 family protein [Stetteria hydrogenophila]
MSLPSERQKRLITSRYRHEVSKLQSYRPASTITLEKAMASARPGVPLADGSFHEFDPWQLREMAGEIPRILWPLVNLPVTLTYERDSSGRAFFHVAGDIWQKRAVGLLLSGELTSEGRSELTVEEARLLLSKYRSLFFVSLRL